MPALLIKGVGVQGQNEVFDVSKNTTPVLSGTFYRTQISLFVAKWRPNKVGRVSRKYRKSPFKKNVSFFQIENYKKA